MDDLIQHTGSLVGSSAFPDGFDRRTFLKVSIGTGFAAAVLPVAAQTMIKTDTEGLTAGTINITVAGKEVPVYRAQPAGKSNLPVVLVISEIFGVHEHIADIARRFAKLGYLALAPDLFVRQGDAKAYTSIPDLIKEVVSKVPDQQVLTDLDAVVAYAKANGGNTDKLGITGFCWGGRITWLYSAHNPGVKAGVAWYGQLAGTKSVLNPFSSTELAPALTVPVLGLYGGKDTGITQEQVEAMRGALRKGKSKSEIIVFPNSGHAFNADYRASYVEADAKAGWADCLAWFKAHGVA
ncbi:carboxymethylenebutenolidase [Actimicrobium sp. GrIS 1.19]|uniref:dienelactone hydrolase family protein n=1 Tax=Actimicrobium sp. GrIS 1.19 TaxID=3071708 RepID=UPI002E017285|nr:carboxymethylenebutenolidase [Actimicrobium sp. GrIS 1.19]